MPPSMEINAIVVVARHGVRGKLGQPRGPRMNRININTATHHQHCPSTITYQPCHRLSHSHGCWSQIGNFYTSSVKQDADRIEARSPSA